MPAHAPARTTANPRRIEGNLGCLVLGIATSGRAPVLAEMLRELESQTVRPDLIVIGYGVPADIAGIAPNPRLSLVQGGASLTVKRNVILDRCGGYEYLLFLDDDFMPQPDYIEQTLAVMARDPEIVMTTGHVIKDGSINAGYTVAEGREILAADRRDGPSRVEPARNGYGCNMAIRMRPVGEHALRFDERLPLYGYFEDIDFSAAIGRWGKIVSVSDARGVHLATKSGRVSGYRMGYSQIANVAYLIRKKSMPLSRGLNYVGRHLVNNVLRSFRPEPFVDRRGRMAGNWRALADLLRGRIDPERVLTL